ncbi:MAG: hypothetical protein IKP32_02465, partial [Clostridia bacterium]|nr:hypothetical protein [Clostridia bacterium]
VTRDDSLVLSIKQLREEWVQGIIPWRGVQGPRRPLPRPPLLFSLFAICVLKDGKIRSVFFVLAKRNEGKRSTAALTGMMQRQRGKDARRFMILGED